MTRHVFRFIWLGITLLAYTHGFAQDANQSLPRWSPDGTKYAVVELKRVGGVFSSSIKIYQVDGDAIFDESIADLGKAVQQMLPDDALPRDSDTALYFFSWAPDSKRYVFTSLGKENYDLFVSPPLAEDDEDEESSDSTEAVIHLTQSREADIIPRWSPDGNSIVFMRGTGLYLIKSQQEFRDPQERFSEQPIPLNGLDKAMFPEWGPFSRRVAFSGLKSGDYDIYIHDIGTGETTQLTDTPSVKEYHPIWSPDGEWLAFYSKREDSGEQFDIAIAPVSAKAPLRQCQRDNFSYSLSAGTIQVATDVLQMTLLGPAWLPSSRHIVYANNDEAAGHPIQAVEFDYEDLKLEAVWVSDPILLPTDTELNGEVAATRTGEPQLAFRYKARVGGLPIRKIVRQDLRELYPVQKPGNSRLTVAGRQRFGIQNPSVHSLEGTSPSVSNAYPIGGLIQATVGATVNGQRLQQRNVDVPVLKNKPALVLVPKAHRLNIRLEYERVANEKTVLINKEIRINNTTLPIKADAKGRCPNTFPAFDDKNQADKGFGIFTVVGEEHRYHVKPEIPKENDTEPFDVTLRLKPKTPTVRVLARHLDHSPIPDLMVKFNDINQDANNPQEKTTANKGIAEFTTKAVPRRRIRLEILKLLSIGTEFQTDLDNGTLSEKLRQTFTDGKIQLSPNATVSLEDANTTWLITDDKQKYIVNKEYNQLNVYREKNGYIGKTVELELGDDGLLRRDGQVLGDSNQGFSVTVNVERLLPLAVVDQNHRVVKEAMQIEMKGLTKTFEPGGTLEVKETLLSEELNMTLRHNPTEATKSYKYPAKLVKRPSPDQGYGAQFHIPSLELNIQLVTERGYRIWEFDVEGMGQQTPDKPEPVTITKLYSEKHTLRLRVDGKSFAETITLEPGAGDKPDYQLASNTRSRGADQPAQILVKEETIGKLVEILMIHPAQEGLPIELDKEVGGKSIHRFLGTTDGAGKINLKADKKLLAFADVEKIMIDGKGSEKPRPHSFDDTHYIAHVSTDGKYPISFAVKWERTGESYARWERVDRAYTAKSGREEVTPIDGFPTQLLVFDGENALRFSGFKPTPLKIRLISNESYKIEEPKAIPLEWTRPERSAMAWRSTLIPGWGQWHGHRKIEGAAFFIGVTGSIIGSILTQRSYNDAKAAYDEAVSEYHRGVDVKEIGRLRSNIEGTLKDTRNNKKRLQDGLRAAAVLMWVGNITHAYIKGPKQHRFRGRTQGNPTTDTGFQWELHPGTGSDESLIKLTLQGRF